MKYLILAVLAVMVAGTLIAVGLLDSYAKYVYSEGFNAGLVEGVRLAEEVGSSIFTAGNIIVSDDTIHPNTAKRGDIFTIPDVTDPCSNCHQPPEGN